MKVRCYHSVTNVFLLIFQVQCIVRFVVEVQKMRYHFLHRSLLLSTNVLKMINVLIVSFTVRLIQYKSG